MFFLGNCCYAFPYLHICCTLRSGLHEIPTMIRTFPHGFENNHACKWISDTFPGMLTYILFLESCLKSICMHGCSPIHVKMFFFLLKSMGQICSLDFILLRTCPHGLENNGASIWFSDNFPGIIHILAFLENCQKSICMHGCSPIHVERS